jgi:hypothetical protein
MIQIQLQRFDPHASLELADRASPSPNFEPFGGDGLTFGDILDAINPLHHIPLVGSLYRKITGDEIDPAMRVAGGALFGGPIGALVSAATLAMSRLTNGSETASQAAESVAVNTPSRQRPEEGFILTSSANRQTDINRSHEQNVVGSQKVTTSDSAVEIRPGGWMVIHAYGALEPDPLKTPPNHQSVSIDVAV